MAGTLCKLNELLGQDCVFGFSAFIERMAQMLRDANTSLIRQTNEMMIDLRKKAQQAMEKQNRRIRDRYSRS